MKTYTNAELNQLVAEFSTEFDQLVKAEAAKVAPLSKADADGDEDGPPKKESSESGSEGGGDDAPPASAEDTADAPPPAAESAPADPAASASAPADPAASADPAAGAAGADPMQALTQAYASLSPDELQMHFLALKQVLMSQQAAAPAPAPGADPAMAGAGAPAPGAPAAAPAPAPAPAPMAPAGPDAVAPLAGEGSKPIDPAATMALKSEYEKTLSLLKKEKRDLESKVEALAETLTKAISKPERKAITAKDVDVITKSETAHAAPAYATLSKDQLTKKLLTVARRSDLKKSDRDLINKFCTGSVKVDALAHLLS